MKSLVTGAAGFIGSHVVDELLAMGHTVVALDNFSGGFHENLPEGIEIINRDILDHDMINRLFEYHKFDYVFHLAAYAAEGLSHFIRRFNYENNLIGSINLINASVLSQVKCFVFTSSIAVYGHLKPPFMEYRIPEPCDPYGIAKYAVELDLEAARVQFGLPFIVFRTHNVYGERQNLGDPYRNVIGIYMNNIMKGVPLPVFGDGEQTRAFTHVSDVAPPIAHSIENPAAYNQIFNLGADVQHSINELFLEVIRAMGYESWQIDRQPARNEVKHAWSDHSRARVVLKTEAHIDLREGLARMAAWAKRVGARQSKPFDGVEVSANLPPSWKEVLRVGTV